ncbi:hypothetical protein LVJ94_06980 [Pendulispora rubella]|uniref:Uncharacterized protein n=2 Tax=Pendulispora rubella TaxID=2741070 RepID=A0ABZ2L894_9BACT
MNRFGTTSAERRFGNGGPSLQRHLKLLGLDEQTLKWAVVTDTQPLTRGASVVQFEQRIGGLAVLGTRASVVLAGTKSLVSIASNLHAAGARSETTSRGFRLAAERAMAIAIQNAPSAFDETSKRVFFADAYGVTPAYYIELLNLFSLIASCHLHGLDAATYQAEIVRVLPRRAVNGEVASGRVPSNL